MSRNFDKSNPILNNTNMRDKSPKLPFEAQPHTPEEPPIPDSSPELGDLTDNPETEENLSQIKTIEDVKRFVQRKVAEYHRKKTNR